MEGGSWGCLSRLAANFEAEELALVATRSYEYFLILILQMHAFFLPFLLLTNIFVYAAYM